MSDESLAARREIREAIMVLREAGVTPEQYRDADVTEHWSIGRPLGESFAREQAFAAARARAVESGEDIQVWRTYGGDREDGELWTVKPDGTTWLG